MVKIIRYALFKRTALAMIRQLEIKLQAVQLPPFPLWLLLGYYAIVVGGWLWNATLQGIDRKPEPVTQ